MNKETFEAGMLAMEGALYSVARTYFASSHDCADAVQEAVLRAWQARDTLREPTYFRTWVIRILINQCKSMLRRGGWMIPVETVPDAPLDAEDPLLYEGVMALDIKYRLPFVLHHVEGYKTREIAQMLRLPHGTVVSRLSRARKLLKDTWTEEVCTR